MSGFGISPESLRAVRNLLGIAADDVASTRRAWDAATREVGAAFVTAECGQAFIRFQQHLFEALGSHHDVLTGLAQATGHSAAGYESTDGAGAERFGSLGNGLP